MFEDRIHLQRIVQVLWFAALIVVVAATVTPGSNIQVPVSMNDKVLHFTAYFGLGLLGGTGWPERRTMLLWSMPLFGLALEFVQGGFVPGRQFDWFDALANAVGAFVGVAASVLARRMLFKVS